MENFSAEFRYTVIVLVFKLTSDPSIITYYIIFEKDHIYIVFQQE